MKYIDHGKKKFLLVYLSQSLASDLQLNPNAMFPDNDNSNMKVLLWNVEDASHDFPSFDVIAFNETCELMCVYKWGYVCKIIYCTLLTYSYSLK